MDISWDPKKAKSNIRKHHVSFTEASTVFEDPYATRAPDKGDPEREVITGYSAEEHVLVVVHIEYVTEGDPVWVRIISARKATPKERRAHQKGEPL